MITRPFHQLPKLFATARELFESRGLGSPADHCLPLRVHLMPFGTSPDLTRLSPEKVTDHGRRPEDDEERLGIGQPSRGHHVSATPNLLLHRPIAGSSKRPVEPSGRDSDCTRSTFGLCIRTRWSFPRPRTTVPSSTSRCSGLPCGPRCSEGLRRGNPRGRYPAGSAGHAWSFSFRSSSSPHS